MAKCRHCGKTLYVIGKGDENKFTCLVHGEDCWWPSCPIAEPMREPVYMFRPCPLPNAEEGIATPDQCAACPIPALQAKAELCDALAEALRKVKAWARVGEVEAVAKAALDKYDKLKEESGG